MMGMTTGVVGTGMLSFIRLGDAAATETDGDSGVLPIINENAVVLFIRSSCPYCHQAMGALNDAGIDHKVVEVNRAMKNELYQLTGSSSVPSAWVKGKYIGGCNDGPERWMGVIPCLRSGKLHQLLKA